MKHLILFLNLITLHLSIIILSPATAQGTSTENIKRVSTQYGQGGVDYALGDVTVTATASNKKGPGLKEICTGECALQKNNAAAINDLNKKMKTEKTCKPIKLNTYFPFLGDKIGCNGTEPINQTTAFAYMIKGLMKLVITIIMVVSFLMIVTAGVLMTLGGYNQKLYSDGIGYIKTVATALALLGASGVILKLINPNFFV